MFSLPDEEACDSVGGVSLVVVGLNDDACGDVGLIDIKEGFKHVL
jgi:hypothetical protein